MHKAKIIYFNMQTLLCILYMYPSWHFAAGCFQCIPVCPKTVPKKRWIMSHYPKPVLSPGTKSLALKHTTAELIQNPAPVK